MTLDPDSETTRSISVLGSGRELFLGMASAPGKVILFGEHAVVYGMECMAATCDKYTFGLVKMSQSSSHSHRHGQVGNHSDPLILECLDIGLYYNSQLQTTTSGSPKLHNDNQTKALEAFLTLAKYLGVSGGHFVIKSEIPVGAGLGSSASFSVVIASLLLLLVAQQDKNRLINGHCILSSNNNRSKKVDINLELVNSLAFMAEKVIHGQPSGVDNTLCTYGGAKIYQKDPVTQAVSLKDLDGFSQFQPSFLLINTNVPKNTMHQVSLYREKYNQFPQIMDAITQGIGAITRSCAFFFTPPAPQSRTEIEYQFAEFVRMNHSFLVAAGMSHSCLDEIHHLASTNGLACKITGAGGGGCALVYLPTHHTTIIEKKNEVQEGVRRRGMDVFETKVGVDGVSVVLLEEPEDEDMDVERRGCEKVVDASDACAWFAKTSFENLHLLLQLQK